VHRPRSRSSRARLSSIGDEQFSSGTETTAKLLHKTFENELEAMAWEEKEREEWRESKSKHDNDDIDTSSFITKLISRL